MKVEIGRYEVGNLPFINSMSLKCAFSALKGTLSLIQTGEEGLCRLQFGAVAKIFR